MLNILRLVHLLNHIVIVFSRDFEVVGHFLPVVLNLPSSCHVAVRHTSIKVVGELAEWIEKHPDYLGTHTLHMVWVLFVFGS